MKNGTRLVLEITGSTGTISIEQGRQLMQWVAEAPDPAQAKGVEIANAFGNDRADRRPPPDRRIFVVEVEPIAEKYHLALLQLRELYRAVCLQLSVRLSPGTLF